jgi:16S rRNA (adenine1518-N6/adenine1519-N6)-dimethyltransferase
LDKFNSGAIKQLGIAPRKSLGQNFLVDDALAQRIVDAVDVHTDDLIFEIGPGLGALTQHLTKHAAHVIAIELDQALLPHLREAVGDASRVHIVHGDALTVNYAQLAKDAALVRGKPFTGVRFVGNLPYYITSAAIRTVLECGLGLSSAVFTVQLEVAERAAASPPDMSLLAVSVQFYGQARTLFRLPPSAFYPQPSVDSAVLHIQPHAQPLHPDAVSFFRWVKAGFSQPRKQLRNTLASGLHLPKSDVDVLLNRAAIEPTRRPETLTLHEWVRLVTAAAENVSR